MNNLKSIDEIVDKAFALAFFILGNRTRALAVVLASLGKLEVAAAAQFKRLYYTPTRRRLWPGRQPQIHRTKVSLSDLHLLQRLIYVETEPYEKELEQRIDALSEEELLVHFVKYLIRISIKRNSFYVTLGLSRLLHNYSTADTMEIYNVLVQDPERVKDDYYYRSRKARMLQEIKERFGSLVAVCRGHRGEERFQTQEASREFIELVLECLNHFSPWMTPCLIPKSFDPVTDVVPALSSGNHDEENRVEINRIHAVVHPDCYLRITTPLKLEDPVRSLSIPRFFLPNGKNNMNGTNKTERRPPKPLDADEIEMLKRRLAENSARRKSTQANLLSVVVDGKERARFDLRRSDSTGFQIDDRAELFEVYAHEGAEAVLLATYVLNDDSLSDSRQPARSKIVLESGQKLTFELSSDKSEVNSGTRFMRVSYKETAWTRAASLALRRASLRWSETRSTKGWGLATIARPAFVGLLLVLCTAALLIFVLRARRDTVPVAEVVANKQQTPLKQIGNSSSAATGDEALQNSNAFPEVALPNRNSMMNGPSNKSENKNRYGVAENQDVVSTPPSIISNKSQKPDGNRIEEPTTRVRNPEPENPLSSKIEVPERDATRSAESTGLSTRLSKVRKVFLDISGDSSLGEQVSQVMTRSLQESQRLSVALSKDDADAALKLLINNSSNATTNSSKITTDEQVVTVFVRMVNEDGEVIWPTKSKNNGRRYNGTIQGVTNRIMKDLLKDIPQSEGLK